MGKLVRTYFGVGVLYIKTQNKTEKHHQPRQPRDHKRGLNDSKKELMVRVRSKANEAGMMKRREKDNWRHTSKVVSNLSKEGNGQGIDWMGAKETKLTNQKENGFSGVKSQIILSSRISLRNMRSYRA